MIGAEFYEVGPLEIKGSVVISTVAPLKMKTTLAYEPLSAMLPST